LKNKIKVLNVAKLKHFFKNIEKSEDEEDDANILFNQNSDQALKDFSVTFLIKRVTEGQSPEPRQN
jgi:hypothetical protein